MWCDNCGFEVNNGTKYCPGCGARMIDESNQYPTITAASAGENNHHYSYTPVQTTAAAYGASGLSVGAFVLSLFLPILGMILGIIDLCGGDRYHTHGFATAAVVIGIIVLILQIAMSAVIGPIAFFL